VTTNIQTHSTPTLDDIDRQIVAFVFRFRREHLDFGPTWSQIRAAVPGLEPARPSTQIFEAWFSNRGQQEYDQRRPLADFRRRHPRLSKEVAYRQWRRSAFNFWLAEGRDPLAARLYRLRSLGYLAFDRSEGSLDAGPVVRAWQQARERV
jgi:hypothetical protein